MHKNGHPKFHGKKGRSGRKTRRIEDLITLVEGYCLSDAISVYEDKTEDPLEKLVILKKRFALTKDLAGKVLSRRIKVGGENEGEAIKVEVYIPQNTGRSWAGANGK